MLGIDIKFDDQTKRVKAAASDGTFRNLSHASAGIRKTAVESIEPGDGPSPPGSPPHTHTQKLTKKGKVRKGQLPRAIVFAVDKSKEEAVIGPRASVVGDAGEAHEFGGEFKGDDYPERPFMGPALEANEARFASGWAGSIGP